MPLAAQTFQMDTWVAIRAGDVVIIPIVNGTFSVSVVGHKHIGSAGSRHEASELAWRHCRGAQVWLVEASGSMVALECPPHLGNT